MHTLALAAACIAIVATWPAIDRTQILELVIITGLTIASELTSFELPAKKLRVSASVLGITLAAVLVGGAPAAVLGILTISVGWLRSHESLRDFRFNLVTYAWFPLMSGLLFHGGWAHPIARHVPRPSEYLFVFATFLGACRNELRDGDRLLLRHLRPRSVAQGRPAPADPRAGAVRGGADAAWRFSRRLARRRWAWRCSRLC